MARHREPGRALHRTDAHLTAGSWGLKLLPEPSALPRLPAAAWGPRKHHHGLRLGDVEGQMRAVQGWVSLPCAT